LNRLVLKNWRNFAAAGITFGPRAVITGPSAAGKSNLLDALCFLRDVASAHGFQEALRRRGGVRKLRWLGARQNSGIGLLVQAGTPEDPAEWEYELQFNQTGQDSPSVKRERLCSGGQEILARPDQDDLTDSQRLGETYLEQAGMRKPVREFAAFLGSIRYLDLAAELMRAPNQHAGGQYDRLGAGLLEEIAALPEKTRHARLRTILEELQPAVPQLRQLESCRDSNGRPRLRALFEHWRSRGAWQSEAEFSAGTLRLLGILWNALEPGGPLLLEEPELSLHEGIVKLIPGMLARSSKRSGRQIIITTHSLDLLCGKGVENSEILLLCPGEEGTLPRPALALSEAAELLSRGVLSEAEAPVGADRQLALFGETSA
jgi:predicted ATPase